ncbi:MULTISPECIES: aldo/keto reductase [unclassified Adlercreutzia]|uniref:aldo/keto reductase n=1 Tax=unclassified Adlercreutzia TaxID=2636013 RepID=UPI0013ED3F53|nr:MULTISPECIES: aldo/keto reductase [unclassified Adlercreutzia]
MTFDVSKISPLGFGCMRFEGRETNTVDIDYTAKMIDRYLEAGGNYFDTAWAYPNSEVTLREALVKRHPRDSFFLTSKCVTWTHCTCEEDLERQLQETLENLGVEYLDMYLMHNLGGKRTATFEQFNAWEFVKRAKERGLARHIGFSAHCTPEELEQLIADYPEAEMVQLQVNYNDWDSPSFRERECVEVARRHGKPVVAMEPVKGGLLANPPRAVREILDAEMPNDSYATAALRFAASAEGVFCALSGMSTLEQVEDNCHAFESFQPLTAAEHATIKRAQEAMHSSSIVPCTGCDYCAKVCPAGIGISGSLTVLNHFINYGDPAEAHYQLGFVVRFNGGKKLPSECLRCGACEEACPQGISILECFDRIKQEITSHAPAAKVLMKP